jgi:L-alanine-DL-glutamate epimerase-like enolase superfamily enzyme
MEEGLVALPGKPGIGVEIDETAVARLRVNSP